MRWLKTTEFWVVVWLAIAIILLASNASSHGTLSWAAEYRSATGIPCCTGPMGSNPGDCIKADENVLPLRIGDKFTGIFPAGEKEIIINVIHLSPDPHAPYVVCLPGCVFKPLLG